MSDNSSSAQSWLRLLSTTEEWWKMIQGSKRNLEWWQLRSQSPGQIQHQFQLFLSERQSFLNE
jgi:hypothetical protein